jgi:hypothetical protein
MPAPKAGALPLGYTPILEVVELRKDTTTLAGAQLPKKNRRKYMLIVFNRHFCPNYF